MCVPWLSTQPGATSVGARIGDRMVTLVTEPGPLFLEDKFPLARTAVRNGEYLLLSRSGQVLARTPVEPAAER
jgi:hypothetical protein